MMMIRRRKHQGIYLLLIPLLFISARLTGQITDFQTRWEAEIEKTFDGPVDLSLSLEQIFKENSLRYDRTMVSLVGKFDLPKGFDVNTGLRWMLVQNNELAYENRGRIHVDLNYDFDISRFNLDLRARLQYGFDDQVFNSPFDENKLVNRYRVRLSYDIFGSRITPSAGVEPYIHLNDYEGSVLYRMRYFAGLEYEISPQHAVKGIYLFDDEINIADPVDAGMIWITYSFQF